LPLHGPDSGQVATPTTLSQTHNDKLSCPKSQDFYSPSTLEKRNLESTNSDTPTCSPGDTT